MQTTIASRRDRLAVRLGMLTVVCLVSALIFTKGTQFLMPGPLASAHGSIENCSTCHTKSGTGKLSWVHGLVAGDPLADSKACLTCHKMPDTAFNAHGASTDVLKRSTERLAKIAAETHAPQSARAQDIAFPTNDVLARDLYCATCHQEHQGTNFSLNKISNEQCRSCHVVKFDSFDGNHPKFENYPFNRRTPIKFDHAGHFGKHYPEVTKKDPTKRIPDTCSTCHNSNADKRVMAVAPFDQTCTGCHLDQIVGKERASGPKGVAFLSLPGLDLQTLKKKNASIGEWPDASEAALTPFMKVMISRNERGRALIKAVSSLNLEDLTGATDDQIKAVTELAWEIKGIFHALIKGKASDVLGDFGIGGGAKLSPALVADLTASIPRDVVVSAQQQWLPNLATEMANRPAANETEQGVWSTETKETKLSAEVSPEELFGALSRKATAKAKTEHGKEVRVAEESSGAITGRRALPSGTARSIDALRKGSEAPSEADGASGERKKETRAPDTQPPATEPAAGNTEKAAGTESDAPKAKAESKVEQPPSDPGAQNDDLLFPTEAELRGMKSPQPEERAAKGDTDNTKAGTVSSENAAPSTSPAPPATAPKSSDAETVGPRTAAAPVISIESDIDPESWAEYGGWYRQDYAIFYRPTGHKDKFIFSWLVLTGPKAPRGDANPTAAVFDVLTGKDAQGSCTKCHSVDDVQSKGRLVNFSPPSVASKQGRFTNFVHEPHFGIMKERGCLTCHELEKDRAYLKSYEQGDPQKFVSGFGEVKKDLCQTCHTSSMARQDCLLCHNYHVTGVATPIMSTKLPTQ